MVAAVSFDIEEEKEVKLEDQIVEYLLEHREEHIRIADLEETFRPRTMADHVFKLTVHRSRELLAEYGIETGGAAGTIYTMSVSQTLNRVESFISTRNKKDARIIRLLKNAAKMSDDPEVKARIDNRAVKEGFAQKQANAVRRRALKKV